MENVFSFFLGQIGKAFDVMQNFEIWQGLSLFDLFIVLLVLDVVIILFVPTLGDRHGDMIARSRRAEARAERRSMEKGKKNG